MDNRTAFITGAGGFIGSEVAKTLARSGIKVAVCDIDEEKIKATVDSITAEGGWAKGYLSDVSNSADIEGAMNKAAEDMGGLDIMVHVAGGSSRVAGPGNWKLLVDQEDFVIEKVIAVNLFGAIYASRAAARIMIKQGRGGKIINFGSTVGVNGLRCSTEYAASKGGVMSFTKALAKELGEHKINVNCVAPGVVCRHADDETDWTRQYSYGTNFLGEKCVPEDVANLVEFLASPKSNFITGQTYIIDGGRSLAMKGTEE